MKTSKKVTLLVARQWSALSPSLNLSTAVTSLDLLPSFTEDTLTTPAFLEALRHDVADVPTLLSYLESLALVVPEFATPLTRLRHRLLAEEFNRLTHAAYTDPLTSLRNRRSLDEDLPTAIALSERSKLPITVIAFDLDGLKDVNDTKGHDEGDVLIITFASHLSASLRASDTAYRLGGDEFLVLLPATDAAQAQNFLSRLRTNIPLHFSAGCATFPPDAPSANLLLKTADAALYEDKRERKRRLGV